MAEWQLPENFKFVDLFSGIGGFHQTLKKIGGRKGVCVFASEIDPDAIATYKKNYGIDSGINIRDVKECDIPAHDVLCAGFPCQSFSNAGRKFGFKDKTRGTLFFEIVRILSHHRTPFIILENVKNIVSHEHGNTWRVITESLMELGYRLTERPLFLSPHQFGIPQTRERVIILGKFDPEHVDVPLNIRFDNLKKKDDCSIYSILDPAECDPRYALTDYQKMVLTAWDEFHGQLGNKIIGFPVWVDFFHSEIDESWLDWKKVYVRKNVRLYSENSDFIEKWLKKHDNLKAFTPTHRKFEWQAGPNVPSVWDAVVQFRESGIRVKRPTCFQALVAMVQTPVIGRYRRRLSVREAARLQSFPEDFKPCGNVHQAYKQFGNCVNVEVIRHAAIKLFSEKPAMGQSEFNFNGHG